MSKPSAAVTIKLHTLSEELISFEKMKQWKWRDREPAKVLQRFIDINRKSFTFLGIDAHVDTRNFQPVVVLRTSQYVGAAPIHSPLSGKPEGDVIVEGRFGEQADEVVAFLQDEVSPEFSDQLKLTYAGKVLPPHYIECIRYLETYIEAYKYHWQKFQNRVSYNNAPLGMTDWTEYAIRSAANPAERMRYKNSRNILVTNHEEWQQLTFVSKLCIETLLSPAAPAKIRYVYNNLLMNSRRLIEGQSHIAVTRIRENMSDPAIIARLKRLANNVLQHKSCIQMAWRIDFNKVFECYVQHIFTELASKCSAKIVRNPRYQIGGAKLPQWGLRYLEPDLILLRECSQVVIDAKYKSHLYNINHSGETEILKEAFRHDLHQILAYTAFSNGEQKTAVLAYPASEPYHRTLTIHSPYSNTEATVILTGIVFDPTRCQDIIYYLSSIINDHL